jgi:Kef-type K+ transport system membrane component KefB
MTIINRKIKTEEGTDVETNRFLLDLALILITTKALSVLIKKVDMPQVVGALVAGLILGPTVLGIVTESPFIDQIAEIGVIVLMFNAGLETDINELKKTGKSSLIIALCGVVLAAGSGFFLTQMFHINVSSEAFMQNIFIGIVLMSTSVSITVETLKEMGKLSTRSGNAILAAALIDDVLGIIALTIITSLADSSVNIWFVVLKIILFFLVSLGVGIFIHKRIESWMKRLGGDKRRFVVTSLAFCLAFAYVGEELFGVADITGAFIAGLIIANTMRVTYVASRFDILSYMILSPVFFASIGCKVTLHQMDTDLIVFSLLMVLGAIVTKIVGCGLGARICKFSNIESARIGIGMISRGEVTLIVAAKGAAVGLVNPILFGPITITVVVTSIITPVLLKHVYKGREKDYSELEFSGLYDQYQDVKNVDLATQALIDMHHELKVKSSEQADSPLKDHNEKNK